MEKVNKVSKDIAATLVIFTEGRHTWVIGSPSKKGLRAVYFDGEEEGRGILRGSILPKASGYIPISEDIEAGWSFGIKFPDRPRAKRILVSDCATSIMVMAGEKQKVSAIYGHVN